MSIFSFERGRLARLVGSVFFPAYWLLRKLPFYRKLPILAQKAIATLLILSVLLSSLYLYLYLFAPKASAAWFDDSWTYRQRVDITNGGTAQTDYQVSITLDTATLITAGKVQSDCDDLRITDTNGKLLYHWLQRNPTTAACNQSATKIWVKMPTISTSGDTVYLYYGNPSAPSRENGAQTFIYFEDFSNYSTGTDITSIANWTKDIDYSSAYTIDTNRLKMAHLGSAPNEARDGAIYTLPTELTSDSAIDADVTTYDSSSWDFMFSAGDSGYTPMGESASTMFFTAIDGSTENWYQHNGAWSLIAASMTPSQTYQMSVGYKLATDNNDFYLDNVLKSTITMWDAATTGLKKFAFGNYGYMSADSTWYVDNIRVRKYAATLPTIASPTNEEKGTAPVAYWKFDDATGTNAQDSSPNNLDGTLGGSTTPAWKTEDQCISGKCLYFDGSVQANNPKVTVSQTSTSPTNITGNLTVSVWIKPTANYLDNPGYIIRNGQGADQVFAVNYDYTNKRVQFLWYDGVFKGIDGSTNGVAINQWSHIVVTRSGTTVNIYVNGAFDATGTSTTPTVAASQLSIGQTNNDAVAQDYTGFIDEVKVYNFALTAAQVKSNYNAKASGDGASAVLGSPSTGSGQLASGLVGYWKMDEATANTCTGGANDSCDSSGNVNDGAWQADATTTTGKFGNGTTFDGTGDYINAGSGASLDITGAVTLSAWVYSNGSQTANAGIIVERTTAVTDDYALVMSGSAFYMNYYGSAWCCGTTTGGSVTTSQWTHIAVTRNSAGTIVKAYTNGVLVNNTAGVGVGSGNGANSVAIGADIGYSSGSYFNGKIDEARIYNRELSPDEVSQLYNFAPGPVGYWNFNEGSGTAASDISGNANTGTITAGTGSYSIGKYGKGYSFDAANTIINAGSGSTLDDLPASGMTVEAWIYPKSIGENSAGFIINKNVGTSQSAGWILLIQGTNTVQFVVDGSTDLVRTTSNSTITLNTWNHVVLSWDGVITTAATADIYVNGVEASYQTTTDGASRVADATSSLYIGNDSTQARTFDGYIDEAKIYNYARSAKQITEDMNAGHPAPGSPVGSAVGHWKFDEGADNTCSGGVKDACNSGNGGNSLDATATGLAVPATATSGWSQAGKFGKGMLFDGTGDYLEVADNTAIRMGTSDWTLSAWIKSSQSSGNYQILDKRNAGPTVRYQMYLGDGKLVTELRSTSAPDVSASVTGATTISDGNWHYVTATFTRSANLVIYVDGRSDGSVSISSMSGVDINATSTLVIGAVALNFSLPFNGTIDEVKVYNFALTAAEVKLDMNRGQAQLLGATSDNTSYALNAANQEYCIPGDSTSCAAPIARWDFNEGGSSTTTADTSGSGNTGTITVGASGSQTTASQLWKPGKAGKALNLDGTDDYVTLGSALNVANTMTITGWFFTNDITKRQTLLALHSGGANTGNIEVGTPFGLTSGAVAMVQYGVATVGNSPAGLYSNGTWVHFAYTRNGAYTTQQFYINGVAVTTTQADLTLSDDAGVGQIGVRTSAAQFFTGSVDNLRVYNYARSAAQIAWDYNRGGPVGHWRFDECQGLTANDSSGNSNSGTITIGATGTYTSAGTCPSGTATHAWAGGVAGAGKRNYALSFDGTDDYGTVADSTILKPSTITVASWVKATGSAGSHIFHKYNPAGPNQGYSLRFDLSGFASFWVGGSAWTSGTTAVNDGSWHHLVGTYDGTNAKVYVDGVLQTTQAQSGNLSYAINATIAVYNAGESNFVAGQIDDLRVYNYALTATQVKMLYTGFSTFYGPSTGAP